MQLKLSADPFVVKTHITDYRDKTEGNYLQIWKPLLKKNLSNQREE